MTASVVLPSADAHAERREKRRRADRISGVIIALAMLGALMLVGERIWAVATGPLPPGPGVAAPAVAGFTPDGKQLDIESQRGKVVLIDFWATWCPPCRAAMPTLESVHKAYGEKGLVVLGVNQEPGDEHRVAAYLKRTNITFESVMDEGNIARAWGVYTFPTSFIVGRDGVIRKVYRGPAPEGRLRSDIEAALADEG